MNQSNSSIDRKRSLLRQDRIIETESEMAVSGVASARKLSGAKEPPSRKRSNKEAFEAEKAEEMEACEELLNAAKKLAKERRDLLRECSRLRQGIAKIKSLNEQQVVARASSPISGATSVPPTAQGDSKVDDDQSTRETE